jgi:hypothetical protein
MGNVVCAGRVRWILLRLLKRYSGVLKFWSAW